MTPLVSLCRRGDVEKVRKLIKDKASVNAQEAGVSPLMVAIESDHVELMNLLRSAGANMDGDGNSDQVVYRYAIDHNAVACVDSLLTDKQGNVPLYMYIPPTVMVSFEDDIRPVASRGRMDLLAVLINHYGEHDEEALYTRLMHRLPELLSPDTKPEDRPIVDAIITAGIDGIDCLPCTDSLTPLMHAVKASSSYIVSAILRAFAAHRTDEELEHYVNYRRRRADNVPHDCSSYDRGVALHYAAVVDNPAIVRTLLDAGAYPDARDEQQRTPLFYAQSVEVARALIDAGADVNCADSQRFRPLRVTRRSRIAKLLMERKANVAVANRGHESLLHQAVQWNNLKLLKVFLESPASKDLWSAAHLSQAFDCAMSTHRPKMIELFVGLGVDVNAVHALHNARTTTTVRTLLAAGADPSLTRRHGETALHWQCQGGNAAVAEALLDAGADVLATMDDGTTSLMSAASSESPGLVQALLRRASTPAFVNAVDSTGKSALIVLSTRMSTFPARAPPYVDAARALLEHGSDVNLVDGKGMSALQHACVRGLPPLVELLVERRADVLRVQKKSGFTALMLACGDELNLHGPPRSRGRDVAALLADPRATPGWVNAVARDGVTALRLALRREDSAAAAALVIAGAELHGDVQVKFRSYFDGKPVCRIGKAPVALLSLAVAAGDATLLNATLDRLPGGPLPDSGAETPRTDGLCPSQLSALLLEAIQQGNPLEMVARLVQAGADLDAKDSNGRFPLYGLYKPDILNLLLDAGASISQTTPSGYSALHIACREGQLETARLLLERGADIDAATSGRSGAQHTPLMLSVCSFRADVVALLLSRMTPGQVNARVATGDTALHNAASFDAPVMADITRQLLSAGAAVDARDARSRTPLMRLCVPAHEHSALPVASLLLEHKADISAVDAGGRTLLAAALRAYEAPTKGREAQARNSADLVSLLLRGPHVTPEWVNARDAAGYTALSVAVLRDAVGPVRLLLEAKAELGAITEVDLQYLHKRQYPLYSNGILQMLIDAGADVSALAPAIQAVLPRAAYSPSRLSLLLRANPPPNLNQQDYRGRTLLFKVLSHEHKQEGFQMLKMLIDAGADPTIPDKSCKIPLNEAKDDETTAALLDAAPHSINHVDGNGRNVFMHSISNDDAASRNVLMSARTSFQPVYHRFLGHLGALDTSVTTNQGDTVLHIAMSMVQTTVVEKLLELPIDVFRGGGRWGYTVMMKPFTIPGYCLGASNDHDISLCLAMVADHVLCMPAVQGRTRKEPGDADGGSGSEEACAKRRRG